jgi:hypothetical protein
MQSICLLTLLLVGAGVARPALAQETNTQSSSSSTIEIARTTDDIREKILEDRIEELEKRITELEGRNASAEPVAAAPAAATPVAAAPVAVAVAVSTPEASPTPDPAPAPAPASAQTTTTASASTPDQTTPAATPAPAAAPTWSVGPIDFAGEVDGYYSFNFNHPRLGNNFSGSNQQNYLYNFDVPANQFSLNYVKLGMSHMPDPVGFEFDIGYGDTMTAINSVGRTTGFDQFVEQAYVSFKPAAAKGFEIDFGKFVTSAGAEVIETYSNWNYSRSLLFAWAIPYYHFGLRATMPVGKHWVFGGQLVNGWNNTVDNNTAKTLGITMAGTYAKWNTAINYYGGPENPNTTKGWKSLVDAVLNLTPTAKLSAYVNYDYGNNTIFNDPTGNFANGSLVWWQGLAGALHYQATSKWSFTPRIEWFDDPQGYAMLGASLGSNGAPVRQTVKEFTGTVEYKFLEGLMWRGEYRYDWSNNTFFQRGGAACTVNAFDVFTPGTCPNDFGLGNSKNQSTITFGVIAYFGPKR